MIISEIAARISVGLVRCQQDLMVADNRLKVPFDAPTSILIANAWPGHCVKWRRLRSH